MIDREAICGSIARNVQPQLAPAAAKGFFLSCRDGIAAV